MDYGTTARWLAAAGWLTALGCGTAPVDSVDSRDILRIGTSNEVKSPNIFGDPNLGIFINISHPPLLKFDSSGNLMPLAAESYAVSTDNRTWTFTLRDDLCWSDGRKVTPEDVLFSIQALSEHNPSMWWLRDMLARSEVTGDHTVVFTFAQPYTRFDFDLASYNIFPEHVWGAVADPMRHINPGVNIGFGPFFIDAIDLDAGLVRFVRNPHWRGTEPRIDGYEIHLYKRPDVLALALEKGEVDAYFNYAGSYPYPLIGRLKQTDRFQFHRQMNTALVFLGINLERAPESDRRFREALSYAIDYEEIIRLELLGYGEVPNRGFIPPTLAGYVPTEKLAYDPAKAKRLLEAAGYKDSNRDGLVEDHRGRNLALDLLVEPEWTRVAELLHDYLGAVGISCVIRSADLNTWMAEKDEYDYDLTVTRTSPWGMLMHANWATGYFDSRRTGQGVLHIVEDPAFLRLSDAILSTRDPERLAELASRVQDYYATELPAIALYWNEIVTPTRRSFTGWLLEPIYGIYNIDTFLRLEPSSR